MLLLLLLLLLRLARLAGRDAHRGADGGFPAGASTVTR